MSVRVMRRMNYGKRKGILINARSDTGTGVGDEYFGLFQRFSNLISANGFLAALGLYLSMGKYDMSGNRDCLSAERLASAAQAFDFLADKPG